MYTTYARVLSAVGQQVSRQVAVLVERHEGVAAATDHDLGDRRVDDDGSDPLVGRRRLEQVRDHDGDRATGRDDDDGAVAQGVEAREDAVAELRPRLGVLAVVRAGQPAAGGLLEPGLELVRIRLAVEVPGLGVQHREVVHLVPTLVDRQAEVPAGCLGHQLGRPPLALHQAVHHRVRPQAGQEPSCCHGLPLPQRRQHVVVGGTPGRLAVADQQHLTHVRPRGSGGSAARGTRPPGRRRRTPRCASGRGRSGTRSAGRSPRAGTARTPRRTATARA